MKTIRHKIFEHLCKTRKASAREIGRALDIPVANVRHHLRVLVREARIELANADSISRRGRPERIYQIPQAALGDNLAALAHLLLSETRLGPKELAQKLGASEAELPKSLGKRLHTLVDQLNRMNYHARWEAGPQGPRVLFSHCPYAEIIADHPALCQMDVDLVSQKIGTRFEQVAKIGEGNHKSELCVFVKPLEN